MGFTNGQANGVTDVAPLGKGRGGMLRKCVEAGTDFWMATAAFWSQGFKVLLVLPRLWKLGEKMAKLGSQPFSWTLRESWKSAAFQWYPVLFFVSHHLRQSPAKISLQKNIFSHIGLGSLLRGSPSFAAGKRPVEMFPGPCRDAFRRTHKEGHRINSPKGEDEQEVWALLSHHQHCGPPVGSWISPQNIALYTVLANNRKGPKIAAVVWKYRRLFLC